MNYILKKDTILKEMFVMCRLLNIWPNNKNFQDITLSYIEIIFMLDLFNDMEKEMYFNMVRNVFKMNNLDTSVFSFEEESINKDDCYNQIKNMFEKFRINDDLINEISYQIDYMDNSNIYKSKKRKNKREDFDLNEIVEIYEKYLNSFVSPTRKEYFRKLIKSNKCSIFLSSNLDESGVCYNFTKHKKYILINNNNSSIDKKLTFFHEMEHAYTFNIEKEDSKYYIELSSTLSELYTIDFLMDINKLNEKEYICFMIKFINSYLSDILSLYEDMIDYENGTLQENLEESNVIYLYGFIGAFHFYLNYSREDAFNIIKQHLIDGTLDDFVPNTEQLLKDLYIFIDGLICRFNELNNDYKLNRKRTSKY